MGTFGIGIERHNRMDQNRNIVLIGIMGCGKTTIGAILAERLGRPFLDMDACITERHGPIPELFARGENVFRDVESAMAAELGARQGLILSTGGGVVLREENMVSLKQNGFVIFLDRPVADIIETVDTTTRPLLAEGAEKLHALMAVRYPLYLKHADAHIRHEHGIEHTTQEILDLLAELP